MDDAWEIRERRLLAAERYRPRRVRLLLIAEAPPRDPSRYFYFDAVGKRDSLWFETMRALFDDFGETASERLRKPYWLDRFRHTGCFLIDVVKDPLPDCKGAGRLRLIRQHVDACVREAHDLRPAGILLIKESVWHALNVPVRTAQLPLLHDQMLPFPGSGQQKKFHAAFTALGIAKWAHRGDAVTKDAEVQPRRAGSGQRARGRSR